jgi:hypothetical protein
MVPLPITGHYPRHAQTVATQVTFTNPMPTIAKRTATWTIRIGSHIVVYPATENAVRNALAEAIHADIIVKTSACVCLMNC